MKKTYIKLIKALVVLVLSLILMGICIYNYQLSAVSKDADTIEVTIEPGMSKQEISTLLEEKGLIRSSLFFNIYLQLNRIENLYASTYELSPNMGVKKIVSILEQGNNYNPNSIQITFPEGKNMRQVATIISENTNNSYEEVLDKANDTAYLQELIEKYWFLSEDILDTKIYYKLEGYLYPDTYAFSSKEVTVEEIFNKMLDQMNVVLSEYKDAFEKSKYSLHQLLALASMAELEGTSLEDRKSIAGVFYNRLDANMSLGSDVTTYYAFGVDMSERDLTSEEFNTYNAYNTRGPNMAGMIPVGPICNPSKASIEAVLEPTEHDYYYFVADKNKKVYFSKTSEEHNQTISELKRKGDWIEW